MSGVIDKDSRDPRFANQIIKNFTINLVFCPVNNLAFLIPREAKESLCEIAASLKLLAMTMYRSVRDMTLASQLNS